MTDFQRTASGNELNPRFGLVSLKQCGFRELARVKLDKVVTITPKRLRIDNVRQSVSQIYVGRYV